MFGVAARLARLPPISSSTWLPESASECTDSASIEDEPDNRNAMNFVTAMPRLASSAAMIALVPPEVLMRVSSPPMIPTSSADRRVRVILT